MKELIKSKGVEPNNDFDLLQDGQLCKKSTFKSEKDIEEEIENCSEDEKNNYNIDTAVKNIQVTRKRSLQDV